MYSFGRACATNLALDTGMRRGELCALRWRDVSLDEGVIRVRRTLAEARATDTYCGETLEEKLPKSNRSNRDVTIPEGTVEFLRHHKQMQLYRLVYNDIEQGEDTPVFCSDLGELYRPSKFTSDFSRFAQHKSFDLTLHGTRHTHASPLLKKGVPIQYVSSRLGHESIEITYKIYAHFLPGDDGGVIGEMGRLGRAAEGHLRPSSRCLILNVCHGLLPQICHKPQNGLPQQEKRPAA